MKNGSLKMSIVMIAILLAGILSISPLKENIQLGLDLSGGAEVTLQAVANDGEEITPEIMAELEDVMRNRVDEFGVSEPIIQIEGDDRLIIQLAGVDDPDEAIETLGKTSKLEFIGPDDEVILSGSELADANGYQASDGSSYIALEFTDEGAEKFAVATEEFLGQVIYIVLDGEVISAPTVSAVITDGEAIIDNISSLTEAVSLASLFRSGALPVDVEILSKRTVGPTLGEDSLDKSLNAGIIGLGLLLLFIVVYYRLPGVIAVFSLIAYGTILIWLLTLFGVVLTLPGIAGFVLTIGMAVDANIIIYERIREELRSGKSLRASIESGFKRATLTILDSNVTTLIAAIILFYLGSGSIQGFAITLAIGLMVSMFSALVITKYLLRWSAQVPYFRKNLKLYGLKEVR